VGQIKKKENGWHIGQPFSLLGQAKIRRVSGFWLRPAILGRIRHAERSEAESKHLCQFVASVRSYYAKEMLRLRCVAA
jgi:hypothetical protein